MTEYLDTVKKIISSQFGIPLEDIEDNSLLDEDLSITDLDLEDLISQIQKKFDVVIPQEKISGFKKIADIISFLYEHAENGD